MTRTRGVSRHWPAVHRGLILAVVAVATFLTLRSLVLLLSEPGIPKVASVRSILGVLLAAFAGLGFWVLIARVREWRRDDWNPTGFARFRVAGYVFFLATIVFLAFLQPFDRSLFELTIGVASGCLVVLLAAEHVLLRWAPRRVVVIADVLLANLCLIALSVECTLRVWASIWPSPLFAQLDSSGAEQVGRNRLEPGEILYGFEINEHGYHDQIPHPRARDEKLVVAIGDSFSIGIVPHIYHYTTVAERRIPWCEIYNIGISAVGPAAYIHMLKYDALPQNPDAVLICLFAGNDIFGTTRRLPDSHLRLWFDRDNVLTLLLPQRLARIAAENAQLGRVGKVQGQDVEFLRQLPEYMNATWPWLFDPTLEEETFSRPAFMDIEEYRVTRICGADRSGYASLFADLLEMKSLCGRTPMLVLLIPDEFQVEEDLWRELVERVPDVDLDRDQPQRLIGNWLADQGVPFLDLLPVLRNVPPLEDGKRHLFHLQDTHFNLRGNRIAGEAVALFLTSLRTPAKLVAFEGVPDSMQLPVPGVPVRIPARARFTDGNVRELSFTLPETRFTSSDSSIISVSDDGRLTGKRLGRATVTIRHGDLAAEIRIEAVWPSIVDLGGGVAGKGGVTPRLRLADGTPQPGSTIELFMEAALGGAEGFLAVLGRPVLGGIQPYDFQPYDPGEATLVSLRADGEPGRAGAGKVTIRIPIPQDMTIGTAVFCVAVFEDEAAHRQRSVSNVLAITPE